MRLLFIINPAAAASQALARWSEFEFQFRNNGIQSQRVFTTRAGEATTLAEQAADKYDVLIAAGGDGTVADVATGILTNPSNRASLGILPLGTGNDVAEVLGISIHADAIRSLCTGVTRSIDVLQVHCQSNGRATVRYALLFAGIGIISDALKKTTPRLKRLFGQRLAYPAGLLRALLSYRSPQIDLVCDETTIKDRFLFVGASNTPIAGGGMRIAPDARIDDGQMKLNLIRVISPWRALRLLRRLSQGRHTNHPLVTYLTAHHLEIKAPMGLEVAADGDLIGCTPARISVAPKALRVMVPKHSGNQLTLRA